MGSLSRDSAWEPGWLRPAWTPATWAVSPVAPLGNQAGSGQPGPRRHGMRCRRPSSDLLPTHRLSTKVFPAPFSPYPPSFQAPRSLPHVFQAPPLLIRRALLPTQLSFEPSLPNCLSRLHVFMKSERPNPRLSQTKTSPENPAERAEEKA